MLFFYEAIQKMNESKKGPIKMTEKGDILDFSGKVGWLIRMFEIQIRKLGNSPELLRRVTDKDWQHMM